MASRIEEILVSMKYDDERRNEYYSTYTVGRFVVCPIKETWGLPCRTRTVYSLLPVKFPTCSPSTIWINLDDALAGTWDSMTESIP